MAAGTPHEGGANSESPARGVRMSEVELIDRSIEKTNVWLKELAEDLGTDDRKFAYRVLRAYLHAVRDRLMVDEAAQLPELVRGIYYEGWVPSRTPTRDRSVGRVPAAHRG